MLTVHTIIQSVGTRVSTPVARATTSHRIPKASLKKLGYSPEQRHQLLQIMREMKEF